MANHALAVNPAPGIDIGITTHGSDWYFFVFTLFGLAILLHSVLSIYAFHAGQLGKSWLHIGPMVTTAALSYTYFTIGSNLGWTGVLAEFLHIDIGDNIRQIFYVRFIGWFLAFPGLLYLFEMNAEVQNGDQSLDGLSQVFNNMVLQIGTVGVFVIGLLIGSLIESVYKWGYFVFALTSGFFSLGLLIYRQLFGDTKVLGVMNILSVVGYTVIFLLYPIAWAVSYGGNVIQPDSEGVFFGILDLIIFFVLPWYIITDAVWHGSLVKTDGTVTTSVKDDVEKRIENDAPTTAVQTLDDETPVSPQPTHI